MNFNYVESIEAFDSDQKMFFYQLFAHFLTVSMRGILFNEGIENGERIERAKWLNEIAHRITYKIFYLQKKSAAVPDAEIWQMIQQNSAKHPKTAEDVNLAIGMSYNYVLKNETDNLEANAAV